MGAWGILSNLRYFFIFKSGIVQDTLEEVDIYLDVDPLLIGIAIFLSVFNNFLLIMLGVSGLKGTSKKRNLEDAKKHVKKAKKIMVLFILALLLQVFVEIEIISQMTDSLKNQLNKLPELVEMIEDHYNEHHDYSDPPFPEFVFKDGKSLQGPIFEVEGDFEDWDWDDDDDEWEEDWDEDSRHRGGRNNHGRNENNHRGKKPTFNIFLLRLGRNSHRVENYESERVKITVHLNRLRYQIKGIVIGVAMVVFAINALLISCCCCCLNGCNKRYYRACESIIKQPFLLTYF